MCRRYRRVTALNLSSRGLSGSLSPYIGNLSFLRLLKLDNNYMQGEIPHEFGQLFKLEFAYLYNNFLVGEIPANLSHCSKLKVLSLGGYYKLVGKIPSEFVSLYNLKALTLHKNNLTGGIPQSFMTKPPGFVSIERNLHVCKAEAASASASASPADEQPLLGEPEQPKFLGIELVTLKKIIPLGLMFFCILFNYTILRDTKDVLVVTAKGSSAEIMWVNLPIAIGFMWLYTKLANVLSKKALFYTVIVPFIAFFGAFGFVLYPLSNYIHPQAFADKLLNVLGPRFLGPLAILRIWSICLFYVMEELWGSVAIFVLFWGFANQITTVDEAKKFYPLFGLGANIALIFSGRTVKYFSMMRKNLGPGVDGWAISLKAIIVVVMGLAICGLYWWVNTSVPLPTRSKKKKEKPKMGTRRRA